MNKITIQGFLLSKLVRSVSQKGRRSQTEIIATLKRNVMGYYNSAQVMKILGIKSATTLIKYEKLGTIKIHRRLGNRKRYRKEDIHKFVGA